MNPLICSAIRNRQTLRFYYKGHARIVEPYRYGVTTAGNEAVRAYQLSHGSESGAAPGWHMFLVSRMSFLEAGPGRCTTKRAEYGSSDEGMSTIYCQL